MLKIQNLHAFYGKSHILHGVDMEVKPGEIVSLLGRNGSGRSTTIKTIMGLVDGHGSVKWNDKELLGSKPYDIARHGLGYVPESRDVFPKLTVEQNLLLGQKGGQKQGRWSLDDMYQMFPRLKELKKRGLAVLLVEQKLTIALDISQRCYVMGHGEVVFHGTPDELRADQYVRREWLEV